MSSTTSKINSNNTAETSKTRHGKTSLASSSIPSKNYALVEHITESWDFEPDSHHHCANPSHQPDRQLEKSQTLALALSRKQTVQRLSDEDVFDQTKVFCAKRSLRFNPAEGSTKGRYEELGFQKPELDAEDTIFGMGFVDHEDWTRVYGSKASPREVRERKYTDCASDYEIDSEDADETV